MRDDLVSLRMLAVSAGAQESDVLRKAAGLVSVPLDIVAVERASEAAGFLRNGDVDLMLLDAASPDAEKRALIEAGRSLSKPPFVVLLTGVGGTIIEGPDAVVAKPRNDEEAQKLIERCIRTRIPTRALIVDDSSTMRSIVRKILLASRFPMEVQEVGEGSEALRRVQDGGFDIIFLDHNLPGLDGLATLTEIKRIRPELGVVIISSTEDQAVRTRAHEVGAAAFLHKPFYPADVDTAMRSYFGFAKDDG